MFCICSCHYLGTLSSENVPQAAQFVTAGNAEGNLNLNWSNLFGLLPFHTLYLHMMMWKHFLQFTGRAHWSWGTKERQVPRGRQAGSARRAGIRGRSGTSSRWPVSVEAACHALTLIQVGAQSQTETEDWLFHFFSWGAHSLHRQHYLTVRKSLYSSIHEWPGRRQDLGLPNVKPKEFIHCERKGMIHCLRKQGDPSCSLYAVSILHSSLPLTCKLSAHTTNHS